MDGWVLVNQWKEAFGVEFRLLTKKETVKRKYCLERKHEDRLGGVSWQSVYVSTTFTSEEHFLESLYYASLAAEKRARDS